MAKTLTEQGVQKIAQRFVDSIDHAAYYLDGEPKTVPLFRMMAGADSAKVYVYFDDTIVGEVSDVQLVDKDGDVVASTDRVFEKPTGKGLYIAFKYKIEEMEVETIGQL